jgi:hypothetical protein
MGVGRIYAPVALALWLGMTAPLAAPAGSAVPEASATGESLSQTMAVERPELNPAPEGIERVGGSFVAMPSQPGALGDPDMVIDRVIAEALDRAHRRVADADLAESGRNATTTELDSGWDDFGSLTAEHRLRRLRQITNLIPEKGTADERLLEADPRYGQNDVQVAASNDWEILRYLREAFRSIKDGTFFTRERVAILAAGLLAVGVLSRVTAMRSR